MNEGEADGDVRIEWGERELKETQMQQERCRRKGGKGWFIVPVQLASGRGATTPVISIRT